MSSHTHRLLLAVTAAALLATGLTSANAVAAAPGASGSGWVGELDVQIDGQDVQQPPMGPCELDGDEDGSSGKVVVGAVATYYGGTSTCTRTSSEEAEISVSGESFITDVLRDAGGPRIRLSGFEVSCSTDDDSSYGQVELRGIRGIEVPQNIPVNYQVEVTGDDDEVLAEVTLNEFVTPQPPDGSMQLNAIRIELFPETAEISGDIVVGAVACDPYGG